MFTFLTEEGKQCVAKKYPTIYFPYLHRYFTYARIYSRSFIQRSLQHPLAYDIGRRQGLAIATMSPQLYIPPHGTKKRLCGNQICNKLLASIVPGSYRYVFRTSREWQKLISGSCQSYT